MVEEGLFKADAVNEEDPEEEEEDVLLTAYNKLQKVGKEQV